MAIIERDVVLMGKSGSDQTIDLPVTRLGNIEDGSAAKSTLVDADAVPVLDSQTSLEMKKITWANLWACLLAKVKGQFYTKDEVESQMVEKVTLGARTAIASSADLNNYKTVGCYAVMSTSIAGTLVNSPFENDAFTLDVSNATGSPTSGYFAQTATNFYTRITKSRLWVPEENRWLGWVSQAITDSQELVLLNGWKLQNPALKAFCSRCGQIAHVSAWIVNPSAIEAWQGSPFLLPYKAKVLCDDKIYFNNTGDGILIQIVENSFNFHKDIPANAIIHINITYICE